MKNLILLLIVAVFSTTVSAEISTSKFNEFTEFRSIGELRLWTFVQDKKTLGTLTSIVKDKTEVDGVDGYLIEEKLSLDYTPVGNELKLHITSDFKVSEQGHYLGEKMTLNVGSRSDEVFAERDADKITGYFSQMGKKTNQEIEFPQNGFSLEANFFDRYELFWAARDIEIGMVVEDTVFMPQSFNKVYVHGFVQEFDYKNLYNTLYDSVYVIGFTRPAEMVMYFTKDKRLVKVIIPSQNLKVYQDLVKEAPEQYKEMVAKRSAKAWSDIFISVVWYLIVGVFGALLFIKGAYKSKSVYLAFILGVVSFGIIYLIQYPLQVKILKEIVSPQIAEGSSKYFSLLIPALFVGLFQELLKLIVIYITSAISKVKGNKLAVVGAAVGAGFGIAEAVYLLSAPGPVNFFSIGILEKSFMIIFHVTSGSLIGFGLSRSLKLGFFMTLITLIVNAFFRYVPVLVQKKSSDFDFFNIIIAFVTVIFVVAVLLLFKKKEV